MSNLFSEADIDGAVVSILWQPVGTLSLHLSNERSNAYSRTHTHTHTHAWLPFMTKVFHPNVHFRTGDVCLDILKKEWSPAWGLQAACRAVLALLSDPDADSPLNCDAGNMVRGGDLVAFNSIAKMYTFENAMFLEWPERRRRGRAE